MSGTCADCVFHKVGEYGAILCRRFPPTPIFEHWTDVSDNRHSEVSSIWPVVGLEDTCGEHKAIYTPLSEHPDA